VRHPIVNLQTRRRCPDIQPAKKIIAHCNRLAPWPPTLHNAGQQSFPPKRILPLQPPHRPPRSTRRPLHQSIEAHAQGPNTDNKSIPIGITTEQSKAVGKATRSTPQKTIRGPITITHRKNPIKRGVHAPLDRTRSAAMLTHHSGTRLNSSLKRSTSSAVMGRGNSTVRCPGAPVPFRSRLLARSSLRPRSPDLLIHRSLDHPGY
jgi:hypothetical protein